MKSSIKVQCALLALLFAAFAHSPARNAQNRRSQGRLPDLTNLINAMKFSPDGRLLAIARGVRDDNRVELWNTESGALQKVIKGFDGLVWSVSFSPDGRTLLTASSGIHPARVSEKPSSRNGKGFNELKWWDSQTGEFKQRFELPDEDLASLAAAYSPDGRYLAAIEYRMTTFYQFRQPLDSAIPIFSSRMPQAIRYDSSIRLLDARTGETVFKLKDNFSNFVVPSFRGPVQDDFASMLLTLPRQPAIFSPDGQLVAAWNSGEVRLWNSVSGGEVLKLNKFKGRVKAIAFSTDSRMLAVALTRELRDHNLISFQSEVEIWELATRAAKQTVPLRTQTVDSLIFAPNGQQLLVAGLQSRNEAAHPSMELVDLRGGSLGSLISRDEGFVSSIEVSPGGDLMAFQTSAATVRLLDTNGWRVRYTLEPGNESNSSESASLRRFLVSVKSVPAVAFFPGGKDVAAEVEGGGIKVWDTRTGEIKKAFAQDAETGSIAEVSADGNVIVEISGDDVIRVWNVANGSRVELPSRKIAASAIGLSGDGQILGVAYPNQIAVFKARGAKLEQITTIDSNAESIAVSLDGKLLAGATAPGDLRVWRTDDGVEQKHFAAGSGISTLRFAPANQALAVGGKDGRISLWDLQTGTLSFEARKHSAIVNAIAFSADGKLMATGSDDRSAIIWDVASAKSRRVLKGHDLTVTALAFSPGADLLAVGSGNASVVLWDVATGKLNRVMK